MLPITKVERRIAYKEGIFKYPAFQGGRKYAFDQASNTITFTVNQAPPQSCWCIVVNGNKIKTFIYSRSKTTVSTVYDLYCGELQELLDFIKENNFELNLDDFPVVKKALETGKPPATNQSFSGKLPRKHLKHLKKLTG